MAERANESRKDMLIAKIRDRRARLDRSLASLEDRIAVISQVKDRALRAGRWTVVAVGVVAVTLTAALLLRAIMRPRGRRR
jgi:hypothetical protein